MTPPGPAKRAHWLRAFGLLLHSELEIPGGQPAGPGTPGLSVVLGPLPPFTPELVEPPYQLGGGSLLFTMPGVARYLVAGSTLTVDPEPNAPAEELSAFLIATALPAALWMRGTPVLHASAAVLPGSYRALAFAGPSGSGKSTLLRHLVRHGALALADDTFALREAGGAFLASGLPACTQHRIPHSPARRLEPIPAAQQAAEAPLAAIFLAGAEPEPRRLHGPAALAGLLRNLHRPLIPRLLGLEAALLPTLASLAGEVPVYSADLRNHPPALDELSRFSTAS